MNKIFKTQKVMFFVYIGLMVVSFLYSLSFMTQYANLFGFEFPQNLPITEFHAKLQAFNKVIFWFSVSGLVSIIAAFTLELKKKVPDKFATILMTVFLCINLVLACYGLFMLFVLLKEYNGIDFSFRFLEDTTLTKGDVYVHQYTAFNFGFMLYAILGIFSVGYTAILWISNLVFIRCQRKAGELDELTN